MEHQYPVAITGDEHMLAELMLPDQAHVRNQDWTIFFLHKDTSQEEEEAELKAERRRRRKRRRDIAEGLIPRKRMRWMKSTLQIMIATARMIASQKEAKDHHSFMF
jgi:hypothetical protein